MIKIFPTIQIKELDAYTIENEPIASIDLMERASQALAKAISERWGAETPFTVFAGPGNNGETRWLFRVCWQSRDIGWRYISLIRKVLCLRIAKRTRNAWQGFPELIFMR